MTGELGYRLLLIDDDPAFGRLVKKMAEPCGFEVIATDDPVHFSEMAASWAPDVIVCDLQMPAVDGIEVLRELAAAGCAAPVLLVSGLDERTLDAALRLGAERGLNMAGTLHKPVKVQEFRSLLGDLRPIRATPLAGDLVEGIRTNQLFLEYQPKLDCNASSVIGVEALVRWQHPKLGVMAPDRLIPLAENSGLIHQLTDCVVGNALIQAADWHRRGIAMEVAVNISAKDLRDLTFPDRLARYCAEWGVSADSIVLELTETAAMRDAVQMMDVLTRLRIKGFRLSIDDFGTGYSSLVQLQRMPFSELKIDRAFVARMTTDRDSRVIVEILIDLARKLGLRSVAEGVETPDVLRLLREMGCDYAQGFQIGRPMSAQSAERMCGHVGENLHVPAILVPEVSVDAIRS